MANIISLIAFCLVLFLFLVSMLRLHVIFFMLMLIVILRCQKGEGFLETSYVHRFAIIKKWEFVRTISSMTMQF